MAGAFDFYVDESLLRRLLSDDPEPDTGDGSPAAGAPSAKSSRNRNSGKSRSVAAPAAAAVEPAAVMQPDLAPVAAAVSAEEPAVAAETPVQQDPAAVAEAVTPHAFLMGVEHWREADEHFAAARYAEAAESYLRCETPQDAALAASLQYNIGIARYYTGNISDSVTALQQAVELSPESAQARLALGLALLDSNRPAEALDQFELAANGIDAARACCRALFALERYEEAEDAIQVVLDELPGDWNALEALMAIRLARRDRQGAAEAATALLKENPDAQNALQVLASAGEQVESAERLAASGNLDQETKAGLVALFQNAGQYSRAAELGRELLEAEQQPGVRFDLLVNLAESLNNLELPQEALDTYQRALEIRPEDAATLWNAALLAEKAGDRDQAVDLITRALEVRPDWDAASLHLAVLLGELGRYDESASAFARCIEMRPEWPEALYEYSLILRKLDRIDEAQEALLQAVHLKPDQTVWIQALERIAIERDDALVALDCHEKLLQDAAEAETAEVAYNLGLVLQQESEPELAAKCYLKALETRPDFEDALLNLGHALFEMGREPEARACWSKAINLNPELAVGYFE
ncbi:hypothetical protein F183_A50160 [Bryobacterales bacterium F-183]|nr:hypothetical protein F183_A50160 [Bryobacterales bacterium F-183]